MNTKDVGNTTEAIVLAALVNAGCNVLLPWGDNLRYDILIDHGKSFTRVQCKTGRLRNGAVIFSTASSQQHRGRGKQGYQGQADIFGVFCRDTGKVYLVPVKDAPTDSMTLRVEPCKRNTASHVNWASDYEL